MVKTTAAAIYSILLDLGYKVALQGTRGFFINDALS
jgi:UDP-N-acetylmuramoyl-L-alanyl-D-glutamate--2,6-diaminopimelate ligase